MDLQQHEGEGTAKDLATEYPVVDLSPAGDAEFMGKGQVDLLVFIAIAHYIGKAGIKARFKGGLFAIEAELSSLSLYDPCAGRIAQLEACLACNDRVVGEQLFRRQGFECFIVGPRKGQLRGKDITPF